MEHAEQILSYLRDHKAEHLEWARDVCRIPSISTDVEHTGDVRRAIEWTRDLCKQIGLETEIYETGGHPLVYAERSENPDAPTYLVYGHMDVQPAGDRGLWDADPFDPVVNGGWLICRGSADDKGQVLVHLRAAAAWLAVAGKLPVNLKFLLEAEEEIASPNLAPFLEKHQALLKCDHILISDTGMYADGWPTITYGTRGLLYKEIRLHGPRHDLHSGSFGGTVANPANVLAQIIAGLHDEHGRVNIQGFYDDVAEASPEERAQIQKLPFDETEYTETLGSPAICGEVGFNTNERRWIRPTLDVNGVYGGFMAEGANTIIPTSAGAKISMRLVPRQDGAKLSGLFDEAIKSMCPRTVRLEILNHGHADAYMAPLDSGPMRAARSALKTAYDKEPALIREGGSLPILPMFKRILGVDSLMLGFASPACNAHGPNEKVNLEDLDRGAEAVAMLYGMLGESA